MITTVCKLSYSSRTVPPIVQAVQGDTGRTVRFDVTDFTIPAGAEATYFIEKPSGEAVYNAATISGNSILCELTAQSLAEPGENKMQVRVILDDEIVTSFKVCLLVSTLWGIDAIESSTEMNIFDQAVEQATEQFQENAEQIVEEVIESIPADYTELTEEVDELNERIMYVYGNTEERIGSRIAQSSNLMPIDAQSYESSGVSFEYENGVMTIQGTGTASVTVLALRFDLMPGTYTIKGWVKSGSAPVIRLYKAGETRYIISNIRNTEGTFTVTEFSTYELKAVLANNWTENSVYNFQLSKGSVSLPFELPNVGTAIDSVARRVIEETDNMLPVEAQTQETGGLTALYADGILSVSGSRGSTGVTNDFLFVLPPGTYTAYATFTSGTPDQLRLRNYTDATTVSTDIRTPVTFEISETKTFYVQQAITDASWEYNFTAEIMVCKGETALDFHKPSFISAVDAVAREKLESNPLTSRLTGKKLVTAGDSITYGDGATSSTKTYGALAANYLGMEFLNIGMSGRTMADISVNGVSRNGFAVERYLLVPDDTDYLTIFFGFNDGAYGKVSMEDDYCMEQYGKYYSQCTNAEKTEADSHANWFEVFVGTINDTDKKTWCGAWNFVLDYFVNTKSIPHIGVFIPYGTDTRMTDPLKQLCTKYAVPYIDTTNVQDMPTVGYSSSALSAVNTHNRSLYTYDGLHPNDAGYERMANAVIQWLQKI